MRFDLPRAVRIAFDETLDLYRAVVGSEATMPSFIEALVAESMAGDAAPEDMLSPVQPGPDRAATEQALAVETSNWQDLPEIAASRREVLMTRGTLALLDDLAGRAGWGEPEDLDAQLRELIALQAQMERRLGALLAAMSEKRAWRELRITGIGHYGEQRLGLSRGAAAAVLPPGSAANVAWHSSAAWQPEASTCWRRGACRVCRTS